MLRFTYRGEDAVQTLERVCKKTGHPKTIRVDNGSELSLAIWTFGPAPTVLF